jgi:bifunctional DNA-binding transcriptional regulator/antitoxin component of YhaV-PrlF toxin-antitoxin module
METAKTYTTEIKSRGQLTIPKKIRERGVMEEGQVVSLISLGDSVLITPRRLPLDEARREIKKLWKAAGVSAEELLAGIQEEREDLFEETYGRKSR